MPRLGRGIKNPQRKCLRCGRFLTQKQSSNNKIHHCNMHCAKLKNGSTIVNGRGASTWHRLARKSIGKKCERCGKTWSLRVHHKDEDISNNTEENKETLCHQCHRKHHQGKVKYA